LGLLRFVPIRTTLLPLVTPERGRASDAARWCEFHINPLVTDEQQALERERKPGSLAEVAELLGDGKRVAADHYVYALTDYREVDRTIALSRLAATRV
jgi:hypothetical protein